MAKAIARSLQAKAGDALLATHKELEAATRTCGFFF
jgi:hypothetical protein